MQILLAERLGIYRVLFQSVLQHFSNTSKTFSDNGLMALSNNLNDVLHSLASFSQCSRFILLIFVSPPMDSASLWLMTDSARHE